MVFVGSPITSDNKDLQRLAKKLRKEKVNVDVVNFGESEENAEKLAGFINTLNGKDGTGKCRSGNDRTRRCWVLIG